MKSRGCVVISLILCQLTWNCLCEEGTQKAEKRFNIKGKEWVAAQKIINKLVDESIASRVKEAEHDVEHLLESNIADHIKKTGKTLLRKLPTECHDKIEHCQTLSNSGVCMTSPKAMREHCAKTCNLCEDRFVQTPHISVNLKQDTKKAVKKHLAILPLKTDTSHLKLVPQKAKAEQSSRKDGLTRYGEEFIPEDTIRILHSIEPLLTQQAKGVMKFHANDLSPENEKIHDAQKLLEYVKVLQPPRKFKFFEEKAHNSNDKKKSTTSEKAKTTAKHENEDKKEGKDKIKDIDNPKPKPNTKAAKSHVAKKVVKKKLKVKGTPLTSLSKTVTYKNHKYKITPVVDWERISKMLESLGYKAVHIVGVKDKKIHQDITEHLRKHGVDKVLTHKGKEKVAAETFVSAVHREKSWHNDDYFKTHCHPNCLHSCVSSCLPGCCPEHDKVSVKTGLAKHCHSSCLTNCVPACGSGCCSAEEERKRGHHFLHYQKIQDYHQAKDEAEAKEKAIAKQHEEPKKQQDNSKCHPQCKQTCVASCGKGCCSEEGERMRDEQERKEKDEREKERKEKERAKALEKTQRDKDLKEIYKTQSRLCPSPCPQVCAPACADDCCAFGKYAPNSPGMPSQDQPHPGFIPNVPYPHSKVIPIEAFACKESCKFSCSYDCPRDCCQPEELALQAAHEAAAMAPPTEVGAPQSLPFQGLVPQDSTCPSPCPGNCYPSCTVACCTSALGLPQENNAVLSPEARSSTNRVLHVTHLVQPISGFNGCALSCASHCTPACARSGCCDAAMRRRRSPPRS